MVSKELCDELHERLLAERQRLEHEISMLSSTGTRSDTFHDDDMWDVVDQHPADQGTELFEREKNMTLLRNLEGSLQIVNEALHKFEVGTYGLCEECGQPIPEKRLRALPEATHCIECQSKLEKHPHTASHHH